MSQPVFRSPRGTPVDVPAAAVEAFRRALGCPAVSADEDGYDEARRLWNVMIDRRPGLIVRSSGPDDVRRSVRFAREHGIGLTARGGGHNIGGRAMADGALVVDLSSRRSVRVEPERRCVVVEPGATLGDLDRGTAPYSLVVPSGIVSETGLAGLALGGGFGWLSRRYGLTCDHLDEADVVTGEGERVTANEQANPELLWSLRGGGGVGIVTRFAFRGQPMDPAVVAGPLFRGPDEREDAMRRFLACAAEAPETLTCMLKLGAAPPAPFLPAQMHAKPVAITIACHSGDPQRVGDDLLALRCDVEPAADLIERRPFVEFQRMFDAGEPKGRRNYWKSEYVSDVDDAIAEILLDATAVLPSPSSNIKVFQLGGAVSRVEPEATAAAHRDARFIVVIATAWDDPADDRKNIDWVRNTYAQVHARSRRGGYVNFLTADASEDESAGARAGIDLDRLARVRQRFDPDRIFFA